MIETIALAFLIAKLRGYKIKPLFRDWPIYPVLLFAIIYIVFEVMIFQGNYYFLKYSSIFKTVYLTMFLLMIIKYRIYLSGIIGSGFIFLGTFLNNVVMNANGGRMPVFPSLTLRTGYVKPNIFAMANDGIHALGNDATKLKLLADIFDVGYCVMSIGDICIRIFAAIVIFSAIKSVNKNSGLYTSVYS